MYSLDGLKRAVRDPVRIGSELNRIINRRGYYYDYNLAGVDVFSEDWDYLILLDACRYDAFAECADLPGMLESRESRGSSSVEFLHGNFADRALHDVVYVTANPWYERLHDQIGAEVHVHQYTDFDPDIVTAAARDAAREYPQKRLVIHYMQPHFPYLADGWRDRFVRDGDLQTTFRQSNTDRDEMWEAYIDNLSLVCECVQTLFDELTGRFVVSSDHGELFGESETPIPVKRYGHPRGVYVNELITVPWLVHENGERRSVIAEPPEKVKEYDEQQVQENLRDLGYVR